MSEPTQNPALSVVIPTRDRRQRLAETLDALATEAVPGGLEVIVVDDGSTDDTRGFLDGMLAAGTFPHPLRLEARAAGGPAAARNRGVSIARGERVLFLGDDTRPAPEALLRHLEMAGAAAPEGEMEVAVQGHVDWDPEREITPLMAFLAPEGPQFYFRGLEHGEPIPFTAVLGSNLSAPRSWLLDEPFDEAFPFAAVEDTELAWRWYRRGRRAVYARDALAWHHHRYDRLEPFLERQRRAGASARRAVRLHPRLLWPLVLRPTAFGTVVALRRLLGRGGREAEWDLACRRAFLRGVLFGAS
ncbi:MAG: glycosyltransferase [Holophagales bacterium]|nr:glycosyltransferase [Holophagales bacterium]